MKAEIFNLWPNGDVPGAGDLVSRAVERRDAAGRARGGYERIMIDKEGSVLAMFLNAMGYTLAVITYRLPADGYHEGADTPLADARRAVRAAFL